MRGRTQICLILFLFGLLSSYVWFSYDLIPLSYGQIQSSEITKLDQYTDSIHSETVQDDNQSVDQDIIFVGDIMLGRDVERRLVREGEAWPYQGISFDSGDSYVVGNFESSIPEKHEPTPNNTFRFATKPDFIPALKSAGFTHLSLANNHSYDFGMSGYNNTLSNLSDNDLIAFGHPTILSTSSVRIIELGKSKVAIVAIHTLFGYPTKTALSSVLDYASSVSDEQIVYVHWGEEYVSKPSQTVKDFAAELVSLGADLVVGHHPHVTQSIEMIDGVPVFYSLGNYIFDQYFSDEVQEGLLLKVSLTPVRKLVIMPISSLESRNQPHYLEGEAKQRLLAKLASISDPALADRVIAGELAW